LKNFAKGKWPVLEILLLCSCGITSAGLGHFAQGKWPALKGVYFSKKALI